MQNRYKNMRIAIVGAGYVGLSNAFLMGISKQVIVIEKDEARLEKLLMNEMPINDEYIEIYKHEVDVNYVVSTEESYKNSDIIFIATNTDYDEQHQYFNLDSIESVMKQIDNASVDEQGKIIVIKSTIPIGYTDSLSERYPRHDIYFSPEFLRESYALYDNLHPDRIVIGGKGEHKEYIGKLLSDNVKKENTPVIYTSSREAEIIKLFANTYLAMRVAFVNELDTFCQSMQMDTKNVLDAIGADTRIGTQYFNPSFGYGGYCLPKDSKQLLQEYKKNEVDSSLIPAIVESNIKRKQYIANQILTRTTPDDTIGIYGVSAKKGVNNYRSSAIIEIIRMLKKENRNIIIYSEILDSNVFEDCPVILDVKLFFEKTSFVVANRVDAAIKNCKNLYTVDVYEEN